MLQTLSPNLGKGGAGLSDGTLYRLLKELQGFRNDIVAGATATTKINLSAIRLEDTILSAWYLPGAGTAVTDIVDITAQMGIVDLRATGTITVTTPADGATAVIRGETYTFRTTANPLAATNEVQIGGNATATAANLAAKINAVDGAALVASSALGVCTIKAVVEGTGGNAYTLVGSTNVTASGANLAGGNATGGVTVASTNTSTGKIVVNWYNKK